MGGAWAGGRAAARAGGRAGGRAGAGTGARGRLGGVCGGVRGRALCLPGHRPGLPLGHQVTLQAAAAYGTLGAAFLLTLYLKKKKSSQFLTTRFICFFSSSKFVLSDNLKFRSVFRTCDVFADGSVFCTRAGDVFADGFVFHTRAADVFADGSVFRTRPLLFSYAFADSHYSPHLFAHRMKLFHTLTSIFQHSNTLRLFPY